jgi:DNA-binding IclR family transcriptional regulator
MPEPKLLDDALTRRYQVPGLERGLSVLEYLDQHPAGRTMIQIAKDLGLPKNAVFRITLTLLQHGYLEREEPSKRFYLSRRVLALGYGALGEEVSLVEQAIGAMRRLRDAVRETVCLTVLVEDQGFVLEQAAGTYPFRCVVNVGMRQPLHASSACKAIVAFLPEEERQALLAGLRLCRLTPQTITKRAELSREWERVRGLGYAVDRGEHIEGIACVSAPIFDREARPVASLTVTGPAGRMPEEAWEAIGRKAIAHAGEVSARLGGSLPELPG